MNAVMPPDVALVTGFPRLLARRVVREVLADEGAEVLMLVRPSRADAARIGAYMASHGLTPDRVIVSPAARCQETWTLMASAMRPAPAVSTLEQIYDATPQDIAGAILDAQADAAARSPQARPARARTARVRT